MGGLLVTMRIAVISIFFSITLGIIFGIIMTSKNKLIYIISKVYLEIIRIMPILVLLFIFYYGFFQNLGAQLVTILVFSLWGIAEMGDLVRSAILSLPISQRQSAEALGLNNFQIYRYVIIPQAFRRILPSSINLATRIIKTTPLATIISVVEVVKVGQQIVSMSYISNPNAYFWVFIFIFFLYFIICYPLSLFSRALEKKWQA
ncbi:MAG: amino acid ABC transporter permease [Campylobacteraceae bacterium]